MRRRRYAAAALYLALLLFLSLELAGNGDLLLTGGSAACTPHPARLLRHVLGTARALRLFLGFAGVGLFLTLWALFGNVRVDCRSDEYEVVPGFSVPVPEGQGQHGTAWWMPRGDAGRVFGMARTSGAARLPADLAERYREERRSIYAAEKRE